MNWTERDLDLFKSKQQRGTAPPPPKEFDLHVVLADILRRWASREWRWTHVGHGFQYASKATAARAHRMGVVAGWPDFQFFHITGRVCFLELKRRGNKPSEAQEELASFLREAHDYLCTDSFEEALNFLRVQEIVPTHIATTSKNPSPKDKAPCGPSEGRPIENG